MKSKLDTEIEAKEKELVTLKLERARLEALPEEKQVAIALHGLCCNWNHTDGCGWFYQKDGDAGDWTEYSRKEYLQRAQLIVAYSYKSKISVTEIIEIFKMCKG